MNEEIERKTIIGKSGVEYMGHYINHYDGCAHGCTYCWSRLVKRRTYEEWIDPKVVVNTIELLEQELPKKKNKIHRLWISNSTDSYQSIEEKIGLTRKILEKLIEHEVRFAVLTKSSLVLRDLDLFSTYEKCCVGLTITCFKDSLREKYEPYASSVEERIEAVKILKDRGVKTFVNIEPILPYSDPIKIVESLRDYDIDWWVFGKLNYAKNFDVNYKQKCRALITFADELNLNYLVKDELRKYLDLGLDVRKKSNGETTLMDFVSDIEK